MSGKHGEQKLSGSKGRRGEARQVCGTGQGVSCPSETKTNAHVGSLRGRGGRGYHSLTHSCLRLGHICVLSYL